MLDQHQPIEHFLAWILYSLCMGCSKGQESPATSVLQGFLLAISSLGALVQQSLPSAVNVAGVLSPRALAPIAKAACFQ